MAITQRAGRAPAPGKLPWYTKLAFGFGDSGMSATSTVIGLFFLYYLTDVVGVSPGLAGAVIFLGRFYDAVMDPLEGYITDHTYTRWGRRRPFFLFWALPFGLSFFMMFACPGWTHQGWLMAFAGLAYILHMSAFTGIGVPYTALTAELTDDYDERTSLTAYRMAFSILVGLVAAVVPPLIVGAFPEAREGYRVMGAIFGAATILPPLVVFFTCREPVRPRPVRPAADLAADPARPGHSRRASRAGDTVRDLWREMLLTARNRPFRAAVLIYLFTWMAIDVLQVTFVYFLRYVMGMEAMSSIVFGLLFLTAALCLPLWVWVSERWSKKVAYAAGIGSLALVLCGVAFLRPGMVTATYALAVLAGIGLSTAHVIPWSMIPDCIEFDELRTGRRREGQHYGFMTFAQKVASSGAIFATGLTLQSAGYVAGAAQSPGTLLAIRLLLGPIPAVLLGLGLVTLVFYPVTRAGHAEVRAQLAARKQAEAEAAPTRRNQL